ncbi:glycosyltransferase family 4 protein [uncultured Cloacibacillus sp.]|uniref:glycosyltransferase family 4 protein n=1 Tax=uncultured Cloacibacillus sp. TaxID=889794 RepID=UPI003208EA7E
MRDKVLMLASVASMIDQFNIPNIKLLIDMGYKVDVACNFLEGSTCSDAKIDKLKNKLTAMGVDYYQIDFARSVRHILQNLKAYRQVLRLMKANRYKFIHCHSPIGGVCGRLAGHKTYTKVIYTAHGFHFYKGAPLLNWFVYYPIEKYLSRYTDVLITINKEDYAIARNKMHAKRTEYVPGVGIDIEKIKSVKVDRNKKRAELGIPKDAIMLLSVGELSRRKNHEVVIRALAEMKYRNVVYAICGKGTLESYLKKLADNLGVSDRVFLLGFRTDVTEICKAADIFVFPSLQEGLPVALMEAMACGLPVVCSNIRGNIDLINDNENGILFNSLDIDAMAVAMRTMLDNIKFRKQCALGNIEIVKQFDLHRSLSAMEEIYITTEKIETLTGDSK